MAQSEEDKVFFTLCHKVLLLFHYTPYGNVENKTKNEFRVIYRSEGLPSLTQAKTINIKVFENSY